MNVVFEFRSTNALVKAWIENKLQSGKADQDWEERIRIKIEKRGLGSDTVTGSGSCLKQPHNNIAVFFIFFFKFWQMCFYFSFSNQIVCQGQMVWRRVWQNRDGKLPQVPPKNWLARQETSVAPLPLFKTGKLLPYTKTEKLKQE